MTQIKIEVPSNDPIALSALGEALQLIAAERTSASEEIDKSQLTGQPSKRDIDAILNAINDKVEAAENNSVLKTIRELQPLPQASADLSKITDTFGEVENPVTREDVERVIRGDNTTSVELKDDVTKREGDLVTSSDVKQSVWEKLPPEDKDGIEEDSCVGAGLDKDGLPWDKRIHSRGKTRLADDTWRLARKPNDKTQEEWDEYVASVKAELKAVQDIPVPSDTVTPPVVEPTLEEVGYDANAPVDDNLTPPVVETETVTPPTLDEQAVADVQASEPVAAVEPPTSVTAPVVTDNTAMPTTFQELMKYITSDAAKRGATNDMIKEVLAQVDPSLTAIPLIANRADLIPTFVAKLEGRLS